jgi:aminoglycoside phosphotransferase (APT) family kinase protein
MGRNTRQVPAFEPPLNELEARLAALQVTGVRRLAGGSSSLTYAGETAERQQVVVKAAPAGVPPVLNRDVLRQARLLHALAGTLVPVPTVLWEDAGEPPEVPPLFVMSYVEGTSFEPLFDLDRDDDVGIVADRMRNAAGVLAALHAVDPDSVGLGGEPVVSLLEECERWSRLLWTVDATLAPGWEDVADRLRSAQPPPLPGGLVHGDFRLGNMLAAGSVISAVIDWEIWTIGDPRVDLGWFLVNADPDTYRRNTRYAGALPPAAELATMDGEVPDLDWFEALACFKSTATWSVIVKHNRRQPEPDPELEAMAAVLPHLLDRAREILGRPRVP